MTISAGRNRTTILTLALLVGCSGGGGGGAPRATVLEIFPPMDFVARGPEGGPFGDEISYTVKNPGPDGINWSVDVDVTWISLSRTSGTVAAGGEEQVTVSVEDSAANGLPVGQHKGMISFTDTDLGSVALKTPAVLSVDPVTPLTVTPGLEFVASGPEGGPFDAETTYSIRNPTGGSINWVADVDVTWISLSRTSGVLAAGGEEQVTASIVDAIASALPKGQHSGTISFTDTDLGALALAAPAILSVDFGPRIDNDAWLSIDGIPFFPIGVWNQLPRAADIAHMKSLGINTYLTSGEQPPEPGHLLLLDLLEAEDMWGVLNFNSDPNVMDHPRLLGWFLPDEPDISGITPAALKSQYDAIRSIDPGHFVAVNLTSRFYTDANFMPSGSLPESEYQAYTDITEIVSFDMYPVTGWNQPTWVYTPGAMTADMLDRYVDHMKPVWAIVEASRQRLSVTPMNTPGPTPEQMRFQVWDAIINGATAIHYFISSFNPFQFINLTPDIEQEMTRTNGQITALSSVILRPPPAINVTSAEAGGMNHNLMLRQDGQTTYLFVTNADMGYNPASINFTFDQDITSVTVYDENRNIIPNGKSFMDSFDALGVHIYEVRFQVP